MDTTESERKYTEDEMKSAFKAGKSRGAYEETQNVDGVNWLQVPPMFNSWLSNYLAEANESSKEQASDVHVDATVRDNEGGLSKKAKAAIRWLHSPIAQDITVRQARETIEQVWGKEISDEVREHTQA